MNGPDVLGRMAIESNGSLAWERRLAKLTGAIKKILDDNGFGFIEPDNGNDDVFSIAGVAPYEFSSRISVKATACSFRCARVTRGPWHSE